MSELYCWVCGSDSHKVPKTMDGVAPLHCIALQLAEFIKGHK